MMTVRELIGWLQRPENEQYLDCYINDMNFIYKNRVWVDDDERDCTFLVFSETPMEEGVDLDPICNDETTLLYATKEGREMLQSENYGAKHDIELLNELKAQL